MKLIEIKIDMKIVLNLIMLVSLFVSVACTQNGKKLEGSIDLGAMIQPVPGYSILQQDDYWVWGASMVRTKDGICHLFYSRWSKEFEFKDWLYRSEIAYATATQPGGPYTFRKVILKGRGADFWDKDMAHNPHIKEFGDMYYLYFISHNVKDLGYDERSNYLFSQRIGFAVAKTPEGPWEVCDQPLVDIQEGKAAHGYVVNPSVCQRPDGSFLMLMKSRPADWQKTKEFTSIICAATAPTPTGPFTICEKPILADETVEDPFLWFQNGKYYAILDDQYGVYVEGRGLVLFESEDGFEWGPSKNILVSKIQIKWFDGTISLLNHLERPQLWFDSNGQPAMLFCATQVKNKDGELTSFNVHIPLGKASN